MTWDVDKIKATTTSLREHLNDLDRRVGIAENELTEVRSLRNRVAAAVRALDPPPPAEKKAPPSKTAAPLVSEEALNGLVTWLRLYERNGDGFWTQKLLADPNFHVLKSDSGIRNGLIEAHSRGLITLDRKGIGGRKIYKVVTDDEQDESV